MEGAKPPREWWLSRVCEEFKCTPSQALKEDAADVLSILEVRAYSQAYAAVTDPDTTEESLQKMGISPVLIDLVMANIANMGR